MSTQNSLVIIKEKIAGVMLDDKRMKADDIAKKVLKGRKRECSTPPKWMQDAFHITKAESENGLCYYVKPKKKEVKNFFFYIHGGGHCMEINKNQWEFVATVVEENGYGAAVPIYPLAPEHNAQDTFDMLIGTYRHLTRQETIDRLVVVGDSTGGGLALSLAVLAWKEGVRRPDKLVLLSPSLDTEFILRNDTLNTYGYIKDINNFKGNLDIGRMPENDDEIILKANKDDYTITQMLDETLNSEFSLQKSYREGDTIKTVKIVGIQYNENNTIYDRTFYVSNEVKKVVRSYVHNQYSDMKTLLNDKYVQYNIETSENVEPGTAIVNDDLKYQFKNNKIINQNINISVSNIYYEDNIDLTITKTFTKSNLKKLTGYTDYSYYQNAIIINPDDYNSLYDKPSYQSSVYVKDASIIDQTMSELENLGLKPKKATDFKVEYENESQIVKIFKVVVTIFVIIVVFFISYLIISIILKSRNIYYTTLRMLGATSNIKY